MKGLSVKRKKPKGWGKFNALAKRIIVKPSAKKAPQNTGERRTHEARSVK
jgi:hypothetical protein